MLNSRGVAFVTYVNEANAEFAKEAMAHQYVFLNLHRIIRLLSHLLTSHRSLDHEEVLNVRWATEDPNPMARAREARRIEEQAAEAIRRALPAEFVAEIEGKDPEARKRRKLESSYGLEGYEAPDEIHFAQGANAVNPVGRQRFEVEYQERPMIEDGTVGESEAPAAQEEQQPPQSTGVFSSSTLAALSKAKVAVASKPAAPTSTGPLVGYGSDSDDDE